jgi:predicted transposase YbfD/YdcC
MARSSRLSPLAIQRFFRRLPDPRQRPTRNVHPLINLVFMAVCAVIANADSWEEIARFATMRRDWFAKYLELPPDNPSHDTFGRVFAAMDPIAFQKCLLAWVSALHNTTQGKFIAIDGKAVREAMARSGDIGPLTLVSAWASSNQVVLAQVAGPPGSNELGALPKLLELLELEGAIVTLDALGCQKEIVAQIVEKHGDYVISVKGNQEKLEAAVHEAFAQALDGDEELRTMETREQGHGRIETRACTVIEVPESFPEKENWQGIKSLAMVTRDYTDKRGERHTGVRYYISSVPVRRARSIAKAVRGHWAIENQLHWVLDVSFNEDTSRARDGHSQANLGIIRRAALGMVKNAEGMKGSINCRRKQAGWDDDILENLILGRKIEQD